MGERRFRIVLCLFWKIYFSSFPVDGIFVQESVPVNFSSFERGVNDIHPNRLRLSFRAHGLHFNLHLYRSNNISLDNIPTFILGNHSRNTPTNQTMAFYRDRFMHSLFSRSTTDTGSSITGHVIMNDHSYYLKPGGDDHYIVEKRAHGIFLGNDLIQTNRTFRARRSIRRHIPPDDIIEARIRVLVLLDYSLYSTFHNLYQDNAILEMKKYFAHVISGVDTVYRNIRDPYLKIRVLIAGFVISSMPQMSPWYENNIVRDETDVYGKLIPIVNSRAAIEDLSFGIVEYSRNYSFPEFDHAMSFTGYDLASMDGNKATLGLAYSNSMCAFTVAWSNSISLVEETRSFESILTAAHELAHSLGVDHDGYHPDISCPERHNFLMAASTELSESGSHLNMYHFSCCSKQQLREVFRSGEKDCIVEPPIVNRLTSGHPGEVYSYDQQCVLRVGRGSQFCQWVHVKFPDIVCEELWCTDPLFPRHCVYAGEPVYGAPCNSGPWCIDGTCMPQEVGKRPPINHMLICCPLPQKLIENGHLTNYDHELWLDAEAHYSCAPGYSVHGGNMVRTCGSDARWSGQLPVCTKTTNVTTLDNSSGNVSQYQWPRGGTLNSENQWEFVPTQRAILTTIRTSTLLQPSLQTSSFSVTGITPSSSSSDTLPSLSSSSPSESPIQSLLQSPSSSRHDSSLTLCLSSTELLVSTPSLLSLNSSGLDSLIQPHSVSTAPLTPTLVLVPTLTPFSNDSFRLSSLTRHSNSSIHTSPTQSRAIAPSPLFINSFTRNHSLSMAPVSPTQSQIFAPSPSSSYTLLRKPATVTVPSKASLTVSMPPSSSAALITDSFSFLYPLPSPVSSPLDVSPPSLNNLLRSEKTSSTALPLTSASLLPGSVSSQLAYSSLTLPSFSLHPPSLESRSASTNTHPPMALLQSSKHIPSSFSVSPLSGITQLRLTPLLSLKSSLSPDDSVKFRSSLDQPSFVTKSAQPVSLPPLEMPMSKSIVPSSNYVLISSSSSSLSSESSSSFLSPLLSPSSSPPPSLSLTSSSFPLLPSSSSSSISPSRSLPSAFMSPSRHPSSLSISSSSSSSPASSTSRTANTYRSYQSIPVLTEPVDVSLSQSVTLLPLSHGVVNPTKLSSFDPTMSTQTHAFHPDKNVTETATRVQFTERIHASSNSPSKLIPDSSITTTEPVDVFLGTSMETLLASITTTDLINASSRTNTSRDTKSRGSPKWRDTENHLRIETGDVLSQHPASYIQPTSSSLLQLMDEESSSLRSSESSVIRTGTLVADTGVSMKGSVVRETSHVREWLSVTSQTIRKATLVAIHSVVNSDVTKVTQQVVLSPTLTSRVEGTIAQLLMSIRNTTNKQVLSQETNQTVINSTLFAGEQSRNAATSSIVSLVTGQRELKITKFFRTTNQFMITTPEPKSKCSSITPLSLVCYAVVATTLMVLQR